MDKYIIKNKIFIEKPIVFLCGSVYNHNSPNDKRKILRDCLINLTSGEINPIIIEQIMSIERFENDSLDMKKYEEIISEISEITYIFLESFSTASELGLFSNSFNSSKITAFIPKEKNLLREKAGYFVKEVLLKKIDNTIVYSPKITRHAFASDYVDEYFGFIDNIIPIEIKEKVEKQIEGLKHYYDVSIIEKDKNLSFFEFGVKSGHCYISKKTLFYLVSSLIYKYKNITDIVVNPIIQNDFVKLKRQLLLVVKNSIFYYNGKIINDLHISDSELNLDDLLLYIFHFIKYYEEALINLKEYNHIISFNDIFVKEHSLQIKKEKYIFDFDFKSIKLIKSKKESVREFLLYNNKKVRKIITYRNDNDFYKNHRLINEALRNYLNKNYNNDYSFAYKKGMNTLKCVNCHIESSFFLKIDIHKFFESIPVELVFSNLVRMFRQKIDEIFNRKEADTFLNKIRLMMDSISYYNSFPIGFVTSPIVSEIALFYFDKEIVKELKNFGENIIYTRYADDMLISCRNQFDKKKTLSIVAEKLNEIGFRLNEEKIESKDLTDNGDYIKFIGLNIVKKNGTCSISIGKKYIKDLAISYVYKKRDEYEILRDKGRINYLKYCDREGYERFKKYVDIYTKRLK